MTDYKVRRDRWDRPLVTTDGGPIITEGGKPVNARPYTRVSTLASALDSGGDGLLNWAACNAAVGLVRDRGLLAQVSALASAHQSPWYTEAKTPLLECVTRARQLGGGNTAADIGTAVHQLLETHDGQGDPEFAPEELRPWIEAYRKRIAEWDVKMAEAFVVCDELQTAGSVDRILQHKITGQIVAAEIKTGVDEPKYPLKATIQVAVYAHSVSYDQETGARTPLGADLQNGLLIHLPVLSEKPRCDLYRLDLTAGWELAQLATEVRNRRRLPKLEKL